MKKEELIRKKNVVLIIDGKKEVGGAITGRDSIRVGVISKVPMKLLKPKDRIPKRVNGMETDVFVTPEIHAFVDRTTRYRPMPGGVSVGHPAVSAGTGTPILFPGHKELLILSNDHVLANSNDAEIGDQTWQPGKADGGSPIDTIGHLSKFAPIHFEDEESICPIARFLVWLANSLAGVLGRKTRIPPPQSFQLNAVDCAVSIPLDPADVSDEILDIGKPTGFTVAKVGDAIKKSGRTSELNHGTVQSTNGIARVNYGGGRIAVFADQIITTKIADPGDSGSVVLNEDNKVVGLLFGGSDAITVVNKISNVINALEL